MQLFDMDNYPKLKFYCTIIVTPEFVARFEAKVVRDDCMPDGCHIWKAAKDPQRYGKININGKTIRASRASYTIYNGEIPHGMVICHRCDNPPCVNPAHLFLGTISDNMKDAVAKGRAKNTKKTHCPQGHAYLGDNVLLWKNGKARKCRLCATKNSQNYRSRKRLAS